MKKKFRYLAFLSVLIIWLVGCSEVTVRQSLNDREFRGSRTVMVDAYVYAWYKSEIIYSNRVVNMHPLKADSLIAIEKGIAKDAIVAWKASLKERKAN